MADQRFPKSVRLRVSSDYRRVQGRGRKLRTRHLLVLFLRGRTESSRWGLVVSKKVGNAVTRNRVKRWLRESIRRRRTDLAGCWDLAVIPAPRAAQADFHTLDAEIEELTERISARTRR